MAYTSRVTFFPSALRQVNPYTSELNLGYADELVVFVDYTAEGGNTSTLDIKVEIADPNGAWYTHTDFAQMIQVGKATKSITVFCDRIRVIATVGTGTVTFSITGVVKTR